MAAAVIEITADDPPAGAAANNPNNNGGSPSSNSDSDSDSKPKSQSETQLSVQNLVDMFTKLNPLAKEFFPSSHNANANANNNNNQSVITVSANTIVQKQSHLHLQLLHHHNPIAVANPNHLHYFPPPPLKHHRSPPSPPPPPPHDNINNNVPTPNNDNDNNNNNSHRSSRRRNNYGQGRRRLSGRSYRAQREDGIRRTVYVSDVDQHVTEERLAGLFSSCGQVVDCRVCGDPHSVLRFAFVEFADEQGAKAALNLGGTVLGYYPVKVLPSKTAILPVNPTFLPRSEDEREMCTRTVYCTNIDKKVSQAEVKNFFESTCGEVTRLRLLGDHVHSTRIAFVEFAMAESAIIALSCSGMVLGTQPIRVSPSKTPVRPRVIRPTTMN